VGGILCYFGRKFKRVSQMDYGGLATISSDFPDVFSYGI